MGGAAISSRIPSACKLEPPILCIDALSYVGSVLNRDLR